MMNQHVVKDDVGEFVGRPVSEVSKQNDTLRFAENCLGVDEIIVDALHDASSQ
jgi:hypothetical protein